MQFLHEYSSDSEEDHGTKQVKRPAKQKTNPKAKRLARDSPIDSISTSPVAAHTPHSTTPHSTTPHHLPPLDSKSFITYSEEYSMNMHKKVAAFAYLSWVPSKQTLKSLHKVSGKALDTLQSTIPNFEKRFTWNSNVTGTTVVHGKFGHTNTNAINALHLTVFPNLFGPSHLLSQMAKNVERAAKAIQIPSGLIKKKSNKLETLMGLKKLCFTMEPTVTVFQSPKTGSVFLGLRVKKTIILEKASATIEGSAKNTEDNSEEMKDVSKTVENTFDSAIDGSEKETFSPSPEHAYLVELTRALGQQADLLKFKYSWAQFSSNSKIAHDNSLMNYHSSLLVCELKPLGKALSTSELQALRKALQDIPPEFMDDIKLETDHMSLQTKDKMLSIKLI